MAKIKWPSKRELDLVLRDLEESEGSLHLNADATPLEQFRYDLCQRLIAYMRINRMKQKELAKKLGIDEPEMSRILRHRIEKVSTDKLARMVQELDPTIKLQVG
jgi:predicted XRE-type DNA-binding protein